MGPGDGRGALMPLMEPAGAGPSFTLGFGRRRAGIGISYTLKEWDADYAGLSVKCVTGSRVIWSVASVVDEKSRFHSLTLVPGEQTAQAGANAFHENAVYVKSESAILMLFSMMSFLKPTFL